VSSCASEARSEAQPSEAHEACHGRDRSRDLRARRRRFVRGRRVHVARASRSRAAPAVRVRRDGEDGGAALNRPCRRAALALLLLVGCGAGEGEETVAAPVRDFDTTACRAAAFVAPRAHPGGVFDFASWTAPAPAPIRLVALSGAVQGDAPEAAGTLARWTEAEVAGWERSEGAGRMRIASPPLVPGLKGATRLRIALRAPGLRQLEVVPSPTTVIDPRVRAFRTLYFSLDAAQEPDAPIVITADIETVLAENWADDRRPEPVLARIEIGVPAAMADRVRIEDVRIEGPTAHFGAAAAGTLAAELRDVIHPAWFVHGDRSVRIATRVPDGAPVLAWYDGSVGGGPRSVAVRAGDDVEELARSDGPGRAWTRQEVSLARWAGRAVEIELRSGAPGVGLFGAPRIVPAIAPARTPNVILYLVDTLRADHLGAYGSDAPGVSPHFDRLATEGTLFGVAISSSAWTKPAIPTLMTGLAPTTHRVGASTYADRLPQAVPLLQERFRDAGWRTGSFSASPLGSTLSGLERGFDTAMLPGHWRYNLGELPHASAHQLQEALFAWQAEEPEAPFFAYVHTMEVHSWREPRYRKAPPGQKPYDFAVQDADARFGELLAGLEARGLSRDTLIVVVSDHGESFGDHGVRDHGTSLYQSQIHIPLLFWAGGALPALTVDDVVGLADVAPTLLDLFGLAPLPAAEGISLEPYFAGATEPVHESVPAERIRYVWEPGAPEIHAIVRQDKKKLIRKAEDEQAFDLASDACESQTLGRVPVDLRTRLDAWLASQVEAAARFARAYGVTAGAAVDAEDVELLKSLGYVE
jgi:arylsulfatase A-like enzyme